MARTLQIKRGLAAMLPTLAVGEFGLTTDTKKLYIGTSSGNLEVGGLPTIGGTMTGDLNMGGKSIKSALNISTAGISTSIVGSDSGVVQFDAQLDMGEYPLTGLVAPINALDAANKQYVDAIKSTQVSANLTTTWAGSGPYTQAVTIAGMTSTKNGMVGLAPSANAAQREAAKAASLMLTSQGTNTITITADGDKPTVALPIVVTMLG